MGLFDKLNQGREKDEGYARSTLPSNRWELFFDIFKNKFWTLISLNLVLLLGFIPLIMCLGYLVSFDITLGASLPFSQNLIMGYPFVQGINEQFITMTGSNSNWMFLYMIPSLTVSSITLSAVCYVIRNMVWSQGLFIFNDFLRGVKNNILSFALILTYYGVILWIFNNVNVAIAYGEMIGGSNLLLSISKGVNIVFAMFFTIMTFYMLTMSTTYKLKPTALIKNSFLFTIGRLPQNVFFLVIVLIPIGLFYISTQLLNIILLFYMMFGFSLTVLIWTIFAQGGYDKFINEKSGYEINRGIYQKVDKRGNDIKSSKPADKKIANPKKKRIKPVDDDSQITQLSSGFSRSDLQKLENDKQQLSNDKYQDDDE